MAVDMLRFYQKNRIDNSLIFCKQESSDKFHSKIKTQLA
jgi:hypothetical protein